MPSSTHKTSARRSHGFTLAEVVVAVLIFGLAAAALGQAVGNVLRAMTMASITNPLGYPLYRVRNEVLDVRSRAALEAGGELEIPVIRERRTDGATETENVRARWEAEIFATRVLNIYLINLTATFDGGGASEKLEFELIVYRPAWADADESSRLIESKEEEFKERLEARGVTEEGE